MLSGWKRARVGLRHVFVCFSFFPRFSARLFVVFLFNFNRRKVLPFTTIFPRPPQVWEKIGYSRDDREVGAERCQVWITHAILKPVIASIDDVNSFFEQYVCNEKTVLSCFCAILAQLGRVSPLGLVPVG